MQHWKLVGILAAAAVLLAPQAKADLVFTLTTPANVTAYPGDTVGWGFNMTTDTPGTDTNYYQIYQVLLCIGQPKSPACINATSAVGTVLDTFDFSLTNVWDFGASNDWAGGFTSNIGSFSSPTFSLPNSGLGGFSIAPTASPQLISAIFYVDYTVLDLSLEATDGSLTIPVSISVSSPPVATVPEPSTFAMAGLAVAAAACLRRRRS